MWKYISGWCKIIPATFVKWGVIMINVTTIIFALINLILLLALAGVGIYVIRLLIKALKIYIKKNS